MGIDLKKIYQGEGGFNYSLPKPAMEKFLNGTGFPDGAKYTEEEQARVFQDIVQLTDQAFKKCIYEPYSTPEIFMTAGAPGSGKNRLMDQIIKGRGLVGRVVMIDPDILLQQMEKTYVEELKLALEKVDPQDADAVYAAKLQCYKKWRSASFACCEWIIANLLMEKRNFSITMTQTSPFAHILFRFIKSQGYDIHVIHVSASDDVRHRSIEERNKTIVQVTDQDITVKAKLLPPRLKDTFTRYADRLDFYYRSSWNDDARLAGLWSKKARKEDAKGESEAGQNLLIFDPGLYDKVKQLHNKTCKTIGEEELAKQGINNVEEVLWETVIPDPIKASKV